MDDPYLVLGVNRDDDLKKIRKRFISLCKLYHPDKTGNEDDLATMKRISEAYDKIKKTFSEFEDKKKEHEEEMNKYGQKVNSEDYYYYGSSQEVGDCLNKNKNDYKEDRAEEEEAEVFQNFFRRTNGNQAAASFLMGTRMWNRKQDLKKPFNPRGRIEYQPVNEPILALGYY